MILFVLAPCTVNGGAATVRGMGMFPCLLIVYFLVLICWLPPLETWANEGLWAGVGITTPFAEATSTLFLDIFINN